MKFDEATEPQCATAKVRQKRPDSSLLRVISEKKMHPGCGYRIRRWERYKVGMSVLHCWETAGLDHLDIGFYEKHGLMTLRPMTQEERQEALRPWDGNNPTRGGTVHQQFGGGERTLSATRGANATVQVPRMGLSLEYFASLVPSHLLGCSGEVFYSGRAAFSRPSLVYLLGINPGSEQKPGPNEPKLRTVEENIEYVRGKPEHFSLYYDSWEEGRHPLMQEGMCHLFNNTDLCPYTTPASNCIFVRTSDASKLHDQRGLEESCWPFHKAVIERLGVQLVLCLGSKARDIVKKRMGCARQPIEEQSEDNNRPWGSRVFRNAAGIVVVGVPHPSRSKWSTPECDPSAIVNRWLREVRQTGDESTA